MTPHPATAGTGPARYSLYIPFGYGQIHRMDDFGNAATGWTQFDMLGKPARVEVAEHVAVLRLFDFASEEEATRAYSQIRNGFLRAIVGASASVQLTELMPIDREPDLFRDGFPREYYGTWEPRTPETDGGIWPFNSYVLPEHERILKFSAGLGQVIRILSPEVLNKWADSGNPNKEIESPKDQLAVRLVAQANTQRVPELEYLNLVRALETLTEDIQLGTEPLKLLEAWKNEAEKQRTATKGTPVADQWADVQKRLSNGSIAEGLRRLADSTKPLDTANPAMKPVTDLRAQISELYDIRSKLEHEGQIPPKKGKSGQDRLHEALPIMRYVVYCVLGNRI